MHAANNHYIVVVLEFIELKLLVFCRLFVHRTTILRDDYDPHFLDTHGRRMPTFARMRIRLGSRTLTGEAGVVHGVSRSAAVPKLLANEVHQRHGRVTRSHEPASGFAVLGSFARHAVSLHLRRAWFRLSSWEAAGSFARRCWTAGWKQKMRQSRAAASGANRTGGGSAADGD